MTDHAQQAIARIAQETDVERLLTYAQNAHGKSPAVAQAAVRRLAEISAKHAPGTVEHACWTMIHTVEATRRLAGAKVARMNRLRPKIDKEGEVAALAYCASRETEGFSEVLAYGLPEMTAEAIVLRYPESFKEAVKVSARARLEQAGVAVTADGRVLARGGS